MQREIMYAHNVAIASKCLNTIGALKAYPNKATLLTSEGAVFFWALYARVA
jgi:hypothetical protein